MVAVATTKMEVVVVDGLEAEAVVKRAGMVDATAGVVAWTEEA